MLYIKDKKFILDNYENLLFDCKDKIKLVREYLENDCGFNKSTWITEEYPNLQYLYVRGSDKVIHGKRWLEEGYTECNINYLLGLPIDILNEDDIDISNYKSIYLKD